MTRDQIIRIAREAGLPMAWISDDGVFRWSELERFAVLVASDEAQRMTALREAAQRGLEALVHDQMGIAVPPWVSRKEMTDAAILTLREALGYPPADFLKGRDE